MSEGTRSVTALLHAWGRGDLQARDDLVPLVYRELKRRAAAYLRRERLTTRCSRRRWCTRRTCGCRSGRSPGRIAHTSSASPRR